ncbi:golgin subfamily A member 4-like isoform X1 [Frieseomelitta varia]|uniref:golgin subfamily A member 4-like isoform X1 n=1 Tax=Frieseomelitta varia TaxID=561572 RepID=UPI001CB6B004|nr:golgin subfamily A member 4-like isoform X1 [Frieseomelitta varia]
MFKKFKDKLAEEMKQSPARLQASMQQLAQAVVSPALSNNSVQELPVSNENFSLTEEGDETPKNSPAKHGFQNVDLMSPTSNSIGISRRSSVSSITSDTSSLFPIYESPANLYHLQSDIDQSASEIDENINPQLDKVSKDQIYSAYRKMQAKYHKYRGRYTDLATHYKELERVKGKLESVLVETQDKVLRRIADLKEQCQLEQQAKAHLEEALRNDIEEKDHIISTLNTKIKLLQITGPNLEMTLSDTTNDKGNLKDNLIDLSTGSSISSEENALVVENAQLKDKLKKLENVVLKYKESLKRNKEKFTEILTEKNTLESQYETLRNSYTEKEKELNSVSTEIKNLTDQMIILKKREEESVISLAENKLSIHRELEDKEEQIKKLQLDLKYMTESKENLSEIVSKYKVELEKLKLSSNTQNADLEKKEIVQDTSNGKSEMQQLLIDLDEKIGLKYHEEDCNKENIEKNTKVHDTEIYQNLKCKLDEKEIELQETKNKLEELQKLTKECQTDKEKLYMEFSNYKLKYAELQNEQEAQKIIAEERKKEGETTIEKLQATIQSLDKELENMRNALIDRDKVCESYNAKVHEYKTILEKTKEKLLIQETEIKTFKEKIQDDTEIIKLNNELKIKNKELLGVCTELETCKSIISDLKNRLQTDSSNINLLYEEKNNLIKNILNYKISAKKLKEDNIYIKNNAVKYITEINNEISVLKNGFDTFLKTNDIIQNNVNLQIKNFQTELKEFEEFKQKYNQLQTELKDTMYLKSNLEINLENYNKQLNEMSIKLEQQCEVNTKNRKLIAEIDNLNFKLYDLQNLPEQVKLLMIESKSLQEKLNNVNAINQLLSDEICDLKVQLEEANNNTKQLQELEQKYVQATKTAALLKSENLNSDKLKEKINILQLEIKILNENLFDKDKKMSTLNEELENKESFLVNLKLEDEKHTKLIEKRENEIIELTKSNETLQQKIQTKIQQLTKLKNIKQKQDATIQKLNDEISEIKASNIELLEQLKTSENEMNMLKSENCQIVILKNNNTAINAELERLKLIQNEVNLENKNLKDKQNEFLKHNQELNESNKNLKQKVIDYDKYNQQLLTENAQLEKEIESCKNQLSEQNQDIDNLNSHITLLNTKLQSNSQELNFQLEELTSYKKKAEETKEYLAKENTNLRNEIDKLNLTLENNTKMEEINKELQTKLVFLDKEVARLKNVEEEMNNLRLEINSLNKIKIDLEEIQSENSKLVTENLSLKNRIAELENINTKLQSYVNNLKSAVFNLDQIESKNTEYKNEIDALKNTNVELLSQIKNDDVSKQQLMMEIDELKLILDEKVAELKLLDTKNMELLEEIERLKSSSIEEEVAIETDPSTTNIEDLKETIIKLQNEIKVLRESNITLNEEMKNINNNKTVDDFSTKNNDKLEEKNKKLEAQLDEALITFQAKELEMHFISNELKNQVDTLKQELKTNEEEQSMRLKQLVKEFQAQLHDKEEELHAALEKRFDRQQNYESNLIQQYKEQLKDFQIELTAKSEQIENLILENKNLISQKTKDINQLMEKITIIKKEHTDEIREIEKKWKSIVQQKTDTLEAKHEEEINELTREWRNERRPDIQTDIIHEELESTSRVAMAAVQSNTGSFHTLQQTLTAQRRELAELRKLMKLRHDTLEDSTEIEYLRNILFEYMMGRETMVLARVIAAVVKFDQEQTAKVLKKEEDKMTLLGSLGLT